MDRSALHAGIPACLSAESGFTLVEILLAVAILAVVSFLVALSFSTTLRAIEVAEDDGGREHLARSCLSLIAQDLITARAQPTSPWLGRNGDLNGQPADSLAFMSAGQTRSRPNAAESDLKRVLYARDGAKLVRFATVNPYIFTVEAVEQVELATGVAGFNLRYYDQTARVWVDVWDGQGRATPPAAVMIELTLLNSRKEPRTFTEYVTIPAQAS